MKHRCSSLAAALALAWATTPLSAQISLTPPEPEARTADSPVTEDQLRRHIAYLADDALEGRFPGTPGETLTAHYIAVQLAGAGFVGGMPDGGWYQPVPLVELTTGTSAAQFRMADGRMLDIADYQLRAPQGTATLTDVGLVWVGHGIDGEGQVTADVRGRVAVLLYADRTGEGAMNLNARRDALVAAGAVGTLLVPPPSITYAQLQRSFTSRRLALASRVSRASIEGILSAAAASALLDSAGLTLEQATSAAAEKNYDGQILAVTATLSADTRRQDMNSYNVIARLPGRQADAGTVLLTGHWDHLGLCRPEGAEDRICNGAVDNASGIAVLLEVGARLGAAAENGDALDRDVMIVATTAEEQGLLGAYHFAAEPPLPRRAITVALNIDTVAVAGRGAPMAVIGRSDHPAIAREFDRVARTLGRSVDSDDGAEDFARRQDGWALTQAGIAALMAGGSFSDMDKLESYIDGDYHTPADQLSDATPLGGAADDADLHLALTRHFGSTRTWPERAADEP